MKGNIKKLAIFVMMAAIAIFIAAATASAGDHDGKTIGDDHRNAIVGEYMYAGMNNCISSPVPPGFDELFRALGPVTYASGTLQGIFTFKPHGKGTVKGRQVSVSLPQSINQPPAAAQHPFASATSSDLSYDFTYEVTDDGTITLEMVPETFDVTILTGPSAGKVTWDVDKISLSGLISKDYKTMTLGAIEPAVWTLTYHPSNAIVQSICGTWRFLTRLEELHK
jgi:hypothetical protein